MISESGNFKFYLNWIFTLMIYFVLLKGLRGQLGQLVYQVTMDGLDLREKQDLKATSGQKVKKWNDQNFNF
jgi:hypothetical protein